MKVIVHYLGCLVREGRHHLRCLSENGIVRDYFEPYWLPTGTTIDCPDYQWQESSGWLWWRCGKCEHVYKDVTTTGGCMTCPVCGNVEQVGNVDGYLEEY